MPKTTSSEISRKLLYERSAALKAFAVRFERMTEQLEMLNVETVTATSADSWHRAVKSLIAYASAVQRSIDAIQLSPGEDKSSVEYKKEKETPSIAAERRKPYKKG